jgi:hypothetical protein
MGNAIHTQCTVLENGSIVVMARVDNWSGSYITQATITAASYTIYLLDEDYPESPDTRTVVANHEDVALTVADVVFDTLQTDSIWTKDATGYNFKYQLDVATNQAFEIAGREYLVVVTLATSGQDILLNYRPRVV